VTARDVLQTAAQRQRLEQYRRTPPDSQAAENASETMMLGIARTRILWIAIAAGVGLIATYVIVGSDPGPHCLSTPCTYYDADGRPFLGSCGAKKGDKDSCYCYRQGARVPPGAPEGQSQLQPGCQK
jgi:hypothetical protein